MPKNRSVKEFTLTFTCPSVRAGLIRWTSSSMIGNVRLQMKLLLESSNKGRSLPTLMPTIRLLPCPIVIPVVP